MQLLQACFFPSAVFSWGNLVESALVRSGTYPRALAIASLGSRFFVGRGGKVGAGGAADNRADVAAIQIDPSNVFRNIRLDVFKLLILTA